MTFTGVTRSCACVLVSAAAFVHPALGQSCGSDPNGDGVVDGADLSVVLAQWGPCGSGSAACAGDINGDGIVNAVDLTSVLAGWGPCAPTVPSWATLIEGFPDPTVVHDPILRAAITASGYAWRVRDTQTQIEMVLIPPGTFDMGCSGPFPQCEWGETSVQVTLTRPFYIGRYEVTQGQWTAIRGSNPSRFQSASDSVPEHQVPNRPVENVSRYEVQVFLSATGMRLPTEAEWEYACRAGTTTIFHSMPGFPNGTDDYDHADKIGWYGGCTAQHNGFETRAVGQKAGNGFGLHDMSGNVGELVSDWYAPYPSSPQVNPLGPPRGLYAVWRGGSWCASSFYARSSHRSLVSGGENPFWGASDEIGFRVARTASDAPIVRSLSPASGPSGGGTAITLKGANLTGTISVMIGGAQATNVQVVDSSTVTAVTPVGLAGPSDVTVRTDAGSETRVGGFTYSNATVPVWATLIEPVPDASVVFDPVLRASISSLGLAWRVRDNATQIEMVLVPPGTYQRGCSPGDPDCAGDEYPSHQVTLTQAFYMGRYEVTQAQWTARMGTNPSHFLDFSMEVPPSQVPNRPVERVSWDTIQWFLNGTGLRLPTEAEWEYAYRAGTTTRLHSAAGFPEAPLDLIAWRGNNPYGDTGNSGDQTRPIGQRAGNALGLHDMSGNVWEWVADRHGPYQSAAQINPEGPSSGDGGRVMRGGSWQGGTLYCRASYRLSPLPFYAHFDAGFRVARTASNTPTLNAVTPTGGPVSGGTPFTLSGSSLAGATSVRIGGVAATTVRVVDSTTITAVAPPGSPGSRDITVTTPMGTVTLVGGFAYASSPTWATPIEWMPDPSVVHDAMLRAAIRATGRPWRVRDTATQIEMVLIPPGTFEMGCSASEQFNCDSDEHLARPVTLTQPFYLGRYEVTQAQWMARTGSNPSWFQSASAQVPASQVPNRPVERVSWNAIQNWLSFAPATGLRLPTEAEWEYAYRAGTTTAFHSMPGYPSGTNDDSQLGTIAWFDSNANDQTRPVGQKAGNGFGLHDMSGNVFEWVNDRDGAYPFPPNPQTDPPGPSSGSYRVLRGGSWYNFSNSCRSSFRNDLFPSLDGIYFGFRVARTP